MNGNYRHYFTNRKREKNTLDLNNNYASKDNQIQSVKGGICTSLST